MKHLCVGDKDEEKLEEFEQCQKKTPFVVASISTVVIRLGVFFVTLSLL